jgi:4-hydroxy-tetrahydrodipicolinate reductase
MKIGLLGYGKMGKEIEAVAAQRSHSVNAIADPAYRKAGMDSNPEIMKERFKSCDVLIDFSTASAIVEHVKFASTIKRPIVIGTTGWQKDSDEVKRIVTDSGIVAVAGSNFSLGVNLFIQAVERAAKLFGQFDIFDCAVVESHHSQKADAPSGTALSIGNTILENFPAKKKIRKGLPDGRMAKDELQINSLRVGSDFGTHSVIFDSENDRVELTHTSRSRRGLALGAILAAEWVVVKAGAAGSGHPRGLYEFSKILSEL